MSFIQKLKNKIFSTGAEKSKDLGHGVFVEIEDLVREQYNIHGLSFFASKTRSLMAGTSASPFKGKGMEFDEVRQYHIGDDVRSIDWRVTARRGETYTKLYKEERERQVVILTDMRESMHFGTRRMFKSVMAARLSALIAWVGLDAGEKVGGIVVGKNKTSVLSPHRSRKKVLGFLNALAFASKSNEEKNVPKNFGVMLSELSRVTRTGGIVFIISDFSDFDDIAKKYLTQISMKCDVVAINVIDKLEEKAPPEDRYLVTDGTSTLTLYADDYIWRDEYEDFFKKRREKVSDFCKKHGIKYILARTEENPEDVLKMAFLSKQKRKR